MDKKVGFVTGGASGIGAEVARQLSSRGVIVAVCDINDTDGVPLAEAIGGKFISCDVSNLDSFADAVSDCCQELGIPSFAHLNAGVMTVGASDPFLAIEDVSLEQYKRITGVNLTGVFNGIKCLLPSMRKNGGTITATASVAGLGALPFDPLYGATKHAVVGLVRAVAAANEDANVLVNCICPGGVDTPIIPDALKANGIDAMPVADLAAEVLDLLYEGTNGEIRVKLKDSAFAVEEINVMSSNGLVDESDYR